MFSSVSRWGSNDSTSGVPFCRRNDQYKRRENAARRDFNKMYIRGFYYYHFCFSFLFLCTLINLHFWPTSNRAWRQYYSLDWWRTIDNKSNKIVRRLLYASLRSVLIGCKSFAYRYCSLCWPYCWAMCVSSFYYPYFPWTWLG